MSETNMPAQSEPISVSCGNKLIRSVCGAKVSSMLAFAIIALSASAVALLATGFLNPVAKSPAGVALFVHNGEVLGNNTTSDFYPYPSGSLVNDSGTVYFISGTTKIPFVSSQVFLGLGYSFRNVVDGDLTNYTLAQNYTINSVNMAHPWGSWLIYRGKIYFSTQDGMIKVPNSSIFASNGGSWSYIVRANSYDMQVLNANPNLSPLTANDPRVYTQNQILNVTSNQSTTTPSATISTGTPNTGNSNSFNTVTSSTTNPSITTSSPLPSGQVNTSYFAQISATGGAGSYSWSVYSGSLPSGLSLALAQCTGLGVGASCQVSTGISGISTTSGTYLFTLRVSSGSQTASKQFTIVISDTPATSTNVSNLLTAFNYYAPISLQLKAKYPSFSYASYGYSYATLNSDGTVTFAYNSTYSNPTIWSFLAFQQGSCTMITETANTASDHSHDSVCSSLGGTPTPAIYVGGVRHLRPSAAAHIPSRWITMPVLRYGLYRRRTASPGSTAPRTGLKRYQPPDSSAATGTKAHT